MPSAWFPDDLTISQSLRDKRAACHRFRNLGFISMPRGKPFAEVYVTGKINPGMISNTMSCFMLHLIDCISSMSINQN